MMTFICDYLNTMKWLLDEAGREVKTFLSSFFPPDDPPTGFANV